MKITSILGVMFGMQMVESALTTWQFMIFCALAVVGLVWLGISAIFGGDHDHDFDHSVDVHGGDTDHSQTGPSFFSPRVIMAFILGFGSGGAIATAYGASPAIASIIAFGPGLVMAVIAYCMASFMMKQQANSNIRPGEVVGSYGTVVTSIPSEGIGEVNVRVAGQIVPYTAMSEEKKSISSGSSVMVVRDLGDRVSVKSA
jgi:membrane protein implicated in regulation of membrane protease activity